MITRERERERYICRVISLVEYNVRVFCARTIVWMNFFFLGGI